MSETKAVREARARMETVRARLAIKLPRDEVREAAAEYNRLLRILHYQTYGKRTAWKKAK